MRMPTIELTLLGVIASWMGAVLGHAAEDRKPLNVLIITADDMNADSSGWMGNKLGVTPHLDAFAVTAHRFVNHHVSAPICQPSRQAFMTGRVPHHSGGLGFNPIRAGVPTLPAILKANGYYTAAINKHEHMKPEAEFPWETKLGASGKNPRRLREQFTQCLKTAADTKRPFFVNANITDPHRPFPESEAEAARATKKRAAKQAAAASDDADEGFRRVKPEDVTVPPFLEDIPAVRREVAQYYTGVARFDVSLGGVLEALRESKHDGDTVVIFLSDHGMSFPFSKATVYRNGTWSPVLIRWPGMPDAKPHDEFVSSVDLLPTLLDILDLPHPPELDGRSWVPLLRGETQAGRDAVVTHVNTVSSGKSFAQRCIRTKTRSLMFHAWVDGEPKFRVEAMSGLSFNAMSAAAASDKRIAARVDQLRIGMPLAFFDLDADPGERANKLDDPRDRDEIETLATRLLDHMQRTNDPQTQAFQQALAKWRGSN